MLKRNVQHHRDILTKNNKGLQMSHDVHSKECLLWIVQRVFFVFLSKLTCVTSYEVHPQKELYIA